jgi:hypothetical protein
MRLGIVECSRIDHNHYRLLSTCGGSNAGWGLDLVKPSQCILAYSHGLGTNDIRPSYCDYLCLEALIPPQ